MKSPHEKDFKKLSIRKSKADLAYKHEQSFYRVASALFTWSLLSHYALQSTACLTLQLLIKDQDTR